jgi:hypothetical protein
MNEARGVTLPELELTIEDAEVSRKRGYLGPETMVYTMLAARERQLTASLEREADLMAEVERLRGKPFSDRMYAALESRLQIAEAQLAAAQNAAVQTFEEWWEGHVAHAGSGPKYEKAICKSAWQAATAAQSAAALVRENEQSAMDAATVEERFELRGRLRETERALERACETMYGREQQFPEHWIAAARAELAKEKANG